jgi:hypothetical protein
MSIITGSVDHLGAAIDVFVGVSRAREEKLRKVGHSVPPAVPMRLVIDTGSYATGLSAAIFPKLGIGRIYRTPVHTTLTTQDKPHLADVFDVSITLVSGMDQLLLSSVRVLSSPSCSLDDPTHGA